VTTLQPLAASASFDQARSHGKFRRSLLILGGGTAGLALGLVLSTGFAHAASASPLPAAPVPSVTTVRPAPSPGTASRPRVSASGITAETSVVGARLRAVAHAVRPVSGPILREVRAASKPLTNKLRALRVTPVSLPIRVPAIGTRAFRVPVIGSGGSKTPIIVKKSSTSEQSRAVTVRESRRPATGDRGNCLAVAVVRSGSVEGNLSHSGSSPSPGPASPKPAPLSPHPQIPPLTDNESSGSSSSGQGTSPLGTHPPTSLLLPELVIGGVFPVRETMPQLLLDTRHSPPG
jgi:hypothetical protein